MIAGPRKRGRAPQVTLGAMSDRPPQRLPTPDNGFAPPAGTRVYAVGDIHGTRDLLEEIQALITADLARRRPARAVVVYLGDYIDRGPSPRGVIDRLTDAPVAGATSVHLRGNHEALLLRFLDEPEAGHVWLANGGATTLRSYGVVAPARIGETEALARASAALRRAIPPRHHAFFENLPAWHVEGGYLFVHAGIRPGRALADQTDTDLLWIRRDFLDSCVDHGFRVVHGHTIVRQPEIRANRIGIDTGAVVCGTLSCVVLEGTGHRWLQT